MRDQTVYFLKGLPASGKSTYAKNKIKEERNKGIITKRINKDDLRAMLDNSIHSKEREEFILTVRDLIIFESLEKGYNVIIDDTNFHDKHKSRVQEIINRVNARSDRKIFLVEVFIDTTLQECIELDSKRENSVGRKVIMDMYNRYLRNTEKEMIPYNPDLPDCIVVDVDGTLALHENRRSPFEYWKAGEDRVNEPIRSLVNHIQYSSACKSDKNLITIVMTGRENLCKKDINDDEEGFSLYDLTYDWLTKYGIHFDHMFMRKEGDHRPDWEVKKELYETYINGQYNVLYVIDDRKQVIDMWRSLGLTVLDVAGNDF